MVLNKDFGEFGGQFIPETLMNTLKELTEVFETYCSSSEFKEEYMYYIKQYVGGPSPLYYADRLTKALGGAKIYLKREDLNHTGAHKINNVIGQILLAKKLGKTRIIAETGAGQHGVAAATGAALFNMECEVFMGEEDIERQKLNVFRMELLGAKVRCVTSGTGTLKDATNAAIREWVAREDDTFYVIGSVVGPHPYPTMVRDFQRIIGDETKKQIVEQEGRLPDKVIACVGGGSNSMGMFYPFLDDKEVELVGVEAGGHGLESGEHALTFKAGRVGVLHGMKTMLLQDEEGQIMPVYSISAGLDYPGVGPEHAYLNKIGRVIYNSATDDEALDAFSKLCHLEGIIPALESSHALAEAIKVAPTMDKDKIIVVCLSGRGDKDVHTIASYMNKNVE
jgi:tryptophan synthase beta chain